MNRSRAVFTLLNECQDCYKCIRVCAVQAIKVFDGRAEVIDQRCIACGRCVSACPAKAKRIRHDLDLVRGLLAAGEKVAVSLAPSWRGAGGHSRSGIITALKALGAAEVSETALGAQEVSSRTAEILNQGGPGLYISGACPVIVDYIRLYKPEFTANIVPIASPALTHARMLKDHFGQDTKVVFIGPCIGKKNEAARHPELLAAALTFEELKIWLDEDHAAGGRPDPDEEEAFSLGPAHEGGLYPLAGGMNEGLRRVGLNDGVQLTAVDSLETFIQALSNLDLSALVRPVFVEALACPGGCIAGPAISTRRSPLLLSSDILRQVPGRDRVPARAATVVPVNYQAAGLPRAGHSLEELREALHSLGKYSPEDEINCSGCGYPSCRDLARALLEGVAEPSMCVSYMRRLATRKAAAMFRAMPSAMVMVDRNLRIQEANESFIRMFTGDQKERYLERPEELAGEPVAKWLEFTGLLKKVLKTGSDLHREHLLYKKRLYNIYVFSIEKHYSIGAVVTDITSLKSGREDLARKAREVISKNISIVQEIACLLGEHMVETEVILNAIAADLEADDSEDDQATTGED